MKDHWALQVRNLNGLEQRVPSRHPFVARCVEDESGVLAAGGEAVEALKHSRLSCA